MKNETTTVKHQHSLNFSYFSGQTFDLTQENMNKMIRDVEKLKEIIMALEACLKRISDI